MISFSMIPDVSFSLYLLIFLSLATGTISGFAGVGGGFIMTPALIIMGFPAPFAVGTGVVWVMGNAVIGTIRHRRLGNVDIKLGIFLIIFMMIGMEIGIRSLNAATREGMAETAVLAASITALLFVGISMFWESSRSQSGRTKTEQTRSLASRIADIRIPPMIHFPTSHITISMWMIMLVGLLAGAMAGFIGVGGGVIIVPSLVYLFGVPPFIGVGTSLFQMIFPATYGAIRYTMDESVIIFAAFIMILGSSIGIYFGAYLTKLLQDISMKYILVSTIFVAILGSTLKIISLTVEKDVTWIQDGMIIITYGGLALIVLAIIGLFITAIRHKNGKPIPVFLESFVKDK